MHLGAELMSSLHDWYLRYTTAGICGQPATTDQHQRAIIASQRRYQFEAGLPAKELKHHQKRHFRFILTRDHYTAHIAEQITLPSQFKWHRRGLRA